MHSSLISATPVLAGDAALPATLLRGSVQAGFPSPAEDLGAQRIDLAQLLASGWSSFQPVHGR